jgi:hypothetical protein
MDAISNRDTQEAIRTQLEKRRQPKPPLPEKVALNHQLLEEKGIFPTINNRAVKVRLPGGRVALAVGINAYGYVVVEGEEHPFNPKAVDTVPE